MKGLCHRDRTYFVQKTTFITKGLTQNSRSKDSKNSICRKTVNFRHTVGLAVMAIIML